MKGFRMGKGRCVCRHVCMYVCLMFMYVYEGVMDGRRWVRVRWRKGYGGRRESLRIYLYFCYLLYLLICIRIQRNVKIMSCALML